MESKLLIPFAAIFLFNRGIIGTVLTWHSLSSEKTHVVVKTMIVLVMGLSYFWIYKIVERIRKKLQPGSKV